MPEAADLIYDVGEGDFEERVLRASSDRPVVVDFWAEWCAPCRMLGPVLEKVVRSYGGKALLAKVDIQSHQDLASTWRIQSIPAVKIFKDGKVVSEFVGALPESEVRRHLEQIIPTEADELISEGKRLAEEGKADLAEAQYRKALEISPKHPGAQTQLAAILLERKEYAEARQLVETVSQASGEHDQAQGILARIYFAETCDDSGGAGACEKHLEENTGDLDRRFSLACCLAAEEKYGEALEQFLQVVQTDRGSKKDKAKNEMVRIFSIIGQNSEQASEYRSKLARVLYC